MARSFVLWLHGLDDSGPANEHIKALFTSSEFRNTVWSFPSAPPIPVTCNNGAITPSWFDIHEIPVTTTPILWLHGMADRTVLFETGQAGQHFLEQAGVSCEFKSYPGLDHSISNEELQDLESWIITHLQRSL